jgi:hypothetical protein
MWQISPMIALDLARERARMLEAEAARDRLGDVLFGDPARAPGPRRLGWRPAVASVLRRLSGGADAVAAAACRAATRLEGSAA